MLLIYTIAYFVSILFYSIGLNLIASVLMITLAIFLYAIEYMSKKRIINIRGLFALGFLGGYGISLLKLSKLSSPYSMTMILAVFLTYFSLYFGVFLADRKKENIVRYKGIRILKNNSVLTNQEVLLIVLIGITFISFALETLMLGFVPLFTRDTPHAYSTFHIFGLHYITTLYIFIPCIALANFYILEDKKRAGFELIFSFIYVIFMALLMVSRAQLIQCIFLTLFILLIYESKNIKKYLFDRKKLLIISLAIIFFIALYIIITINRAHDVKYLNGIFEMKNENMPIFITQPYMYIAHNFENLNYMINNIFRHTFGRRILFPVFTLTMVKKFFPIVVDSPYYIIKPELSTVTLVYDFYYDFGLAGIIIFMFIIGYVGKKLENSVYYFIDNPDNFNKNNYKVILLALFSYYMFFSFFQSYFSLTDTWVHIVFVLMLSIFIRMSKGATKWQRKVMEQNQSQS